jgi:hypothetical protein
MVFRNKFIEKSSDIKVYCCPMQQNSIAAEYFHPFAPLP